jgi:hypothetical protein
MSWTFQATPYQTKRDYHAAVVLEWLSGGGLHDRQSVRKMLAATSDDELADEAIEGCTIHGEESSFERDGLTQAFAEYRNSAEASPVEDNEASNRTLW